MTAGGGRRAGSVGGGGERERRGQQRVGMGRQGACHVRGGERVLMVSVGTIDKCGQSIQNGMKSFHLISKLIVLVMRHH